MRDAAWRAAGASWPWPADAVPALTREAALAPGGRQVTPLVFSAWDSATRNAATAVVNNGGSTPPAPPAPCQVTSQVIVADGQRGQYRRVRRRRPAPRGRGGGTDRARQRLHRDLAARRDAAERLVHRPRAPARPAPGGGPGRRLAARLGAGSGRGAGRRACPGRHVALRRVRLPARHVAVRVHPARPAAGQRRLLPAGQQQHNCKRGSQHEGEGAGQHDPVFSTTR